MSDMFKEFLLIFTPIFATIDVIGIMPMFLSLSGELEEQPRRKLIRDACLAAFIVGVLFIIGGEFIFRFFGITTDDFRIGGGILLFIISIIDLLFSNQEERRKPDNEIAIVPVGIPLILGPATLTTLLILSGKHGMTLTSISLFLNLAIVFVVFFYSKHLSKFLGKGITKAIGKVAALFLLAFSIMMIRVGLTNIWNTLSDIAK